ncbi:MAG: aspartate/tyrosine/aromatic aminotransferase [Duodenibacillus sp.]|nr:aspartate/tyrosine/aromatic aminotransferase [Duodenibacillus sp.]
MTALRPFAGLAAAPADPIIGISDMFRGDPRPFKVNLTVGNYLGADGRVPLQATVHEAERRLWERARAHSYLPILGIPEFSAAVAELAFGKGSEPLESGRVASMQAVGGTGALFMAGMLARAELGSPGAAVCRPTWGNHIKLFEEAGLAVSAYRYWDKAACALDFEGMLEDLRALPAGTLTLFQVCCHNPTGLDLTHEQWEAVLAVVEERGLLPLLDMAYQGFADGLEADAWPVRRFAESGVAFLLTVSLSKGFGVYGERTATLHACTQSAAEAEVVASLMKKHARAVYSSPPAHGAEIAALILADPELRPAWEAEVEAMRRRVIAMRLGLHAEGLRLGVDLRFALEQKGIFSFTGFTAAEMRRLREEFAIYGIDSGRIPMAGLTEPVLGHVARGCAAVIKARG